MTGEQMCETVAWVFFQRTGAEIDPRAIWNHSASGELWHVIEMFDEACFWIAEHHGAAAP